LCDIDQAEFRGAGGLQLPSVDDFELSQEILAAGRASIKG
jgi:hypothetical protein